MKGPALEASLPVSSVGHTCMPNIAARPLVAPASQRSAHIPGRRHREGLKGTSMQPCGCASGCISDSDAEMQVSEGIQAFNSNCQSAQKMQIPALAV